MATELATSRQQQLGTHSGASALGRIGRLASIADCDSDQARRLLPSDAAALVEQARDEARSWLVPATRRDAKLHLAPTLALVAPVGMTENDVTVWLATAMHTLSGIPADLLDKGCQAARLKVDHPSKIVAAIHAEVSGEWARRRAALATVNAVEALIVARATPTPAYATAEEIAAIKAEFGLSTDKAKAKPAPATKADYLAMGLSEFEACKAVADHESMLARGTQPIGATDPPRKAVRIKPPLEIGYGLIGMALARRYEARRRGDERTVTGLDQTLAGFLSTYGKPPLAILLRFARDRLRQQREDIAA